MANFTKNAIKASFLKLLDEKPYSSITVRNIVDDCGVNRNTFYYHFQDIPSLLQEIVQEELERIILAYPSIQSMEDCLDVVLHFALAHRRAVLHIYQSINREVYEQYLWQTCEYATATYLDTVFPDYAISDFDREVILGYLKSECFGIVTIWLSTGMKSDIQAAFHRLCEIKRDQMEEMLRRCSNSAEGMISDTNANTNTSASASANTCTTR